MYVSSFSAAVHEKQKSALQGEPVLFDVIRVGDLINYRTPLDNLYGLVLNKGRLGNVGRSDSLWASWETSVARALDPKEPYVAHNRIRPQDEVFIIKHDVEPTDALKKELYEQFIEFAKTIYRRTAASYASPGKPIVEHKHGHVRVGKTRFVYWPKKGAEIRVYDILLSSVIGAALTAAVVAPIMAYFSKVQLKDEMTGYLHGIADSLERAV